MGRAFGKAVALTALPAEYAALRRQLADVREAPAHPYGTRYEVGLVLGISGDWQVMLAEIGEGNAGAAAECERAIAHIRPELVLFFGVAGTLRPDEVKIGDVVVPTKVAAYHGGRDGERFHARPETFHCSYALIQLARALRREPLRDAWLKRLDPRPSSEPAVHTKPVASGEAVVTASTSATAQLLREHYDDAVAVEMESAGMLRAAWANSHVAPFAVRGISDVLVDRRQTDTQDGQRLAARHAAAFTAELLARLDPRTLHGSETNVRSVATDSSVRIGNLFNASVVDTRGGPIIGIADGRADEPDDNPPTFGRLGG
jgi:nucleoside phosphorylase